MTKAIAWTRIPGPRPSCDFRPTNWSAKTLVVSLQTVTHSLGNGALSFKTGVSEAARNSLQVTEQLYSWTLPPPQTTCRAGTLLSFAMSQSVPRRSYLFEGAKNASN